MMTVGQVCKATGVDQNTLWHMVNDGVLSASRYARQQYDPREVLDALPEFRWRRKYSGDFSPLKRRCKKCGEVLPIGRFRRVKCKKSKYGYWIHTTCRSCESAKRTRPDPEQHKQYQREWRSRPDVQKRLKESRKRRESTPQRRLERRISNRMREALSSDYQGGKWREALPYSIAELRDHLERQFVKGMSWENMHQWHIDHIVPKSSFSYSSPDEPDFLACWALSNLRPLWASENISKGSRRETLL